MAPVPKQQFSRYLHPSRDPSSIRAILRRKEHFAASVIDQWGVIETYM